MSAVIARNAIAPVMVQPNVRAEQVTQLILGEAAEVLDRSGEWRRVRACEDGYEGWVHVGYLLEVGEAAAADWRERARGWCEGATLRVGGWPVQLPLRARVALEDDAVVLPDGRRGRVVAGAVRPRSAVRTEAATTTPERWALEHFGGAPYEWGGVTAWGVDCSGFIQTTFAARGVAIPRDSSQQARCGDEVAVEAIRTGDLLFFTGETGAINHVAFAGDGDTLIHSTIQCGGVLVESWVPGTRAASLRERLVAVRRVVER